MARTERGGPRGASRPAALLLTAAAAGALLAGCGQSRTPVPSVTRPLKPHGYHALHPKGSDFALLAPRNWSYLSSEVKAPVVMIDASGQAVIAVTQYKRSTAPPSDPSELAADQAALVKAIHAQQPGAKVISQRTLTISGQPAIQLKADERISGQPRRVLSTHVLLPSSELVLEEYAPPRQFAQVRKVFEYVAGHFALFPAGASR